MKSANTNKNQRVYQKNGVISSLTPRKTFSHDINEIQRTVSALWGQYLGSEEEEEESMEGEEEGEGRRRRRTRICRQWTSVRSNEFEVYEVLCNSDPVAHMII